MTFVDREVIMGSTLGVMFLGEAWPHGVAWWGVALVLSGIGAFAWLVSRPTRAPIVLPAEPHA